MDYPVTLKIVWCNQMLDIPVKSLDTIRQVKIQIELTWDVPVAEQMLYISSQRHKVLEDDKTLEHYGITTHATIDFSMRVEDPT